MTTVPLVKLNLIPIDSDQELIVKDVTVDEPEEDNDELRRKLERRALIQSVSADDKMIVELTELLEMCDNIEMTVLLAVLKKNAEDRRKAFLQIIRDIEKQYNMKPYKRK